MKVCKSCIKQQTVIYVNCDICISNVSDTSDVTVATVSREASVNCSLIKGPLTQRTNMGTTLMVFTAAVTDPIQILIMRYPSYCYVFYSAARCTGL